MSSKDIHKDVFDESTFDKLKIFQDYTKEWLPVFIKARTLYWKTINIIDFFAGPGHDSAGNAGSPELILKELAIYNDAIKERGLKVNVYLNEFKKAKFTELKAYVESVSPTFPNINIEISNLDFKEAYANWEKHLTGTDAANLVFFDQNGIKHMSGDLFKKIITFKRTDFLFFVSSSHARRFCEHESISQYLTLNKAEIDSTPFYQIHRLIQEYYKSLIPTTLEFHLGRFSLKKNSGNINGIIFGSGHPLGMEKFLKTAWKVDHERGEANYDIDEEGISPSKVDLFSGVIKPKKIEAFENELTQMIKGKKLVTDKDIYLFSLQNGILPTDATRILKEMHKNRVIKAFAGSLNSNVCKKNAVLNKIELF
ncbi:MAG: three-Cys-motif partner protein TcmP [Bacteroidota bacterium]